MSVSERDIPNLDGPYPNVLLALTQIPLEIRSSRKRNISSRFPFTGLRDGFWQGLRGFVALLQRFSDINCAFSERTESSFIALSAHRDLPIRATKKDPGQTGPCLHTLQSDTSICILRRRSPSCKAKAPRPEDAELAASLKRRIPCGVEMRAGRN